MEELEKHYEKFNIFDSIGMNTQEIRHSNFLAWLFRPKENQGIGDFFIKEFLKNVLKDVDVDYRKEVKEKNAREIPTIFDIDCWDLSEIEVKRECNNIDILILDDKNGFLCVIENKINSKEHSKQCKRYYELIEGKEISDNTEFKEYKEKYQHRLYLYLKPEKDEEIEQYYIYAPYEAISATIDKVKNKERVSSNLLIVLEHYQELLKRDILENKAIENLCFEIYNNNHEAIDIIKDICCNNEDLQNAFKKCLTKCIENEGLKIIKKNNTHWIKFTHNDLQEFDQSFWYAFDNNTNRNSYIDLRIQFHDTIKEEIIKQIYNDIYKNAERLSLTKNGAYILIKKIIDKDNFNELKEKFLNNGYIKFTPDKTIKEYLKLNDENKINKIKEILETYKNSKSRKPPSKNNDDNNENEYSEEIKKRCKSIYSNHKRAIDEIIEHVPQFNLQYKLANVLIEYLNKNKEKYTLNVKSNTTRNIYFKNNENQKEFWIINNTNKDGIITIQLKNNKKCTPKTTLLGTENFKYLRDKFYENWEILEEDMNTIIHKLDKYLEGINS